MPADYANTHPMRNHYENHIPAGTPEDQAPTVQDCSNPVCQRFTAMEKAFVDNTAEHHQED